MADNLITSAVQAAAQNTIARIRATESAGVWTPVVSGMASAPIDLISSVSAMPGASGGTTAPINTTGASLLVLALSTFVTGSTPTDSKGNTYIPLTLFGTAQLFYCIGGVVGAGHTFSTDSQFPLIVAMAFSGVGSYHTQNGQGSGNPSQPGPVVPTVNGSLIVTAIGGGLSGASPTVDSGFTLTGASAYSGGVVVMGGAAYLVQPTAASVNPTWSSAGSATKTIAIADFSP